MTEFGTYPLQSATGRAIHAHTPAFLAVRQACTRIRPDAGAYEPPYRGHPGGGPWPRRVYAVTAARPTIEEVDYGRP